MSLEFGKAPEKFDTAVRLLRNAFTGNRFGTCTLNVNPAPNRYDILLTFERPRAQHEAVDKALRKIAKELGCHFVLAGAKLDLIYSLGLAAAVYTQPPPAPS